MWEETDGDSKSNQSEGPTSSISFVGRDGENAEIKKGWKCLVLKIINNCHEFPQLWLEVKTVEIWMKRADNSHQPQRGSHDLIMSWWCSVPPWSRLWPAGVCRVCWRTVVWLRLLSCAAASSEHLAICPMFSSAGQTHPETQTHDKTTQTMKPYTHERGLEDKNSLIRSALVLSHRQNINLISHHEWFYITVMQMMMQILNNKQMMLWMKQMRAASSDLILSLFWKYTAKMILLVLLSCFLV